MKAFVIFVVAFLLHSSDATFGKHGGGGGGNFALSGNFHGLLGGHGSKPSEEPAAPIEPPPPAPIEPSPPASNNNVGSGFSLGGNLHGLLKNHRLLSSFHGKKESAPAASSFGSGFALSGNIQGLLKNHRLLGVFHGKKETTTATPIDLGFEGDNEGYSVSTGDFGPEPVEVIPEPIITPAIEVAPEPIVTIPESSVVAAPQPESNNVGSSVSGSASFSSSGGHNIHKILGDVVGAKVKLLQQAQAGITRAFDNHIRNFDNLATKFNNKGQNGGGGSSFHGKFSLHG